MICEYCGEEFFKRSHKKGNTRKYCSTDCYKKAISAFKYTTCQYCGKLFKEARDRQNLFCSKKCSALWHQKIMSEKRMQEEKHTKELLDEYSEILKIHTQTLERLEVLRNRINNEKRCKICGQFFIAKYPNQICCSQECSTKNQNRNKDRRIYKNGKPDLSITLTKLYMRDEGVCQICGKHIDFDCDPNGDDYPSIDHIQPLSKGGLHSWDNVQLSCRKCNWIKRDKE